MTINAFVIAQDASDYYPFHVGDFWIYKTDSTYSDKSMTSRVEVETIDSLSGVPYYRMRQRMIPDDGSEEENWYSWLRPDTNGIVMGGFSETPNVEVISIPYKTITVDGIPDDWSGIDTLVSDPQGDDSPSYTGDDIKALYAARDVDNLYLRMDLWDNVNTNFGNGGSPYEGAYMFVLFHDSSDYRLYPGIAYDRNLQQWSLGYNGSSSDMPSGLEGPEYVGVKDSVIEMKIPLGFIGDPDIFYEIRGLVHNCCLAGYGDIDDAGKSTVRVFDPPYLWTPNDITGAGYTWEFDSPEMGGFYSFSVESTSTTVQVPAGTFNDCTKIKLIVTHETDTVQVSYHYYAPAIGEVLNTGWSYFYLNTFRLELTSYNVQTGPVSIQKSYSTPVAGDSLTITSSITPPFSPTIHKLYYRKGGQNTFQETDFQSSGSNFVGTIPSAYVTIRGIEYYIYMKTGQTEATYPATNPLTEPGKIKVQVDQYRPSLSVSKLKYKMVSVPLELESPEIDSVLLDDYGEYNTKQWRLFRYNPQDTSYYDEYPDIDTTFTPGTAFWLINRQGSGFDVENGWSVDTYGSYTVNLDTGWNQIGNPFAFSVAWSSVNITGDVEAPAYYNGSDYQYNVSILNPWEGYFVRNRGTRSATLSIPPVEATNELSKTIPESIPVSENEYVLKLSTTMPGFNVIDTQNFIGFLQTATDSIDYLDISEAPPIGDYVRLSVMENGMRFAGSFKSFRWSGQHWLTELSSTIPGKQKVQIRFIQSGQLPESMHLYILDRDFKCPIPVKNGKIDVWLGNEFPIRHLQMIIGTEDFANDHSTGISLIPLAFELYQNYPNPFNPETSISYQLGSRCHVRLDIFNILGVRVRTLVNEIQDPGTHAVKWEGLNNFDQYVAAGIYFYRIETEHFVAAKKLIFLR